MGREREGDALEEEEVASLESRGRSDERTEQNLRGLWEAESKIGQRRECAKKIKVIEI